MRRSTAALTTALALVASPAPADLGDDATRLASAWRAHGAVHRLPPRLAERGAPTVIFAPTGVAEPISGACSTIAVLGPSSTHFTVRPVGGDAAPQSPEDWPQPSLAGLVQLSRCGRERVRLSALLVEMRSPRALIETVAVVGRSVRPAVDVLPRRHPGPIAPLGAIPPRAAPIPMLERLKAAEVRAHRDGSESSWRERLTSSPHGTGAIRRRVEPGCYRLEVLAEAPAAEEPAQELEVEPVLDAAASLVSVQRGDGLDATVTACAGDRSLLGVDFLGAASSAEVWVVGAQFALPAGLPESWGATGRARVAAVLHRHNVHTPGGLIDHALGVQGPTLVPVGVEPGACYLGVLVAVRGIPQTLALAAVAGQVRAQNHSGPGGEGTLVSFCARSGARALFESDARGIGLFSLFALFQSGRTPVGVNTP